MKNKWIVTAGMALAVTAGINAKHVADGAAGVFTERTEAVITESTDAFLSGIPMTVTDLYGEWIYSEPAVEFTGTDLISVMAGSVASPKIKEALSTIYAKSGMTKDEGSLEFTPEGKCIGRNANSSASGKYVFDKASQSVVLTVRINDKGDTQDIAGWVSMTEGVMRLMFEADTIAAIVRNNSTQGEVDQTLDDILALVSNYKGVYLGIEMVKK